MLETPYDVIRCLITYPDWYQPPTSSVLQVGGARLNKNYGDGLNPGLIETFEERWELCSRMAQLSDRDRRLLFLWYVRQLHVDDISDEIGVSRRHCFRLRVEAIRKISELGRDDQAA